MPTKETKICLPVHDKIFNEIDGTTVDDVPNLAVKETKTLEVGQYDLFIIGNE